MAYEQRSQDEGMTPLPPELKARFDSWGISRSQQDRFRDDLNATEPTPEELTRVIEAKNPWAIVYGELQKRPKPPESERASTIEKRQSSGRITGPRYKADRLEDHSFPERSEELRRPRIIAANPEPAQQLEPPAASNGHHQAEPDRAEPAIKGADPMFLELIRRDYPNDEQGNQRFARALEQFQVGLGMKQPEFVAERDLNPRNYARFLAFQQEAQRRGIPL